MNPLVNAFFVGRALAEVVNQTISKTITNALSELGKFDAEQRENLRKFTEEVMERARQDSEAVTLESTGSVTGANGSESEDLQATIDELRAEIAQVRAELQRYRSNSRPWLIMMNYGDCHW